MRRVNLSSTQKQTIPSQLETNEYGLISLLRVKFTMYTNSVMKEDERPWIALEVLKFPSSLSLSPSESY